MNIVDKQEKIHDCDIARLPFGAHITLRCKGGLEFQGVLFGDKIGFANGSYMSVVDAKDREMYLGWSTSKPDDTDRELREKQVFGSFQIPSDIEQVEDCGELHNIEGITYEGQELGNYNLDHMIDGLELD